jgi:hypothetical protein
LNISPNKEDKKYFDSSSAITLTSLIMKWNGSNAALSGKNMVVRNPNDVFFLL